jgi:hypothetical protein
MKQETNNEMDLLLRRLARRPETSISDGNGDVDHLDADELSAYAENVVPAAARPRYTEHLAECARCRELVVQLSSSAGAIPVVETTAVPAPSALRKFLAGLFSPMVLRYAVPALGLILVAAIGVFVLRQKKSGDDSIAQNVQAPTSTTITATPEPVQPARGLTDQSKGEATAGKPAQSSGSPGNQPAAAAPQTPVTAGAVADTSREATVKQEEAQPVITEAAPPPAPKPATANDEIKRQNEAEARKEPSPEQYAKEPPAEKTVEAAKVEDRKAAEAEIAKARSDSSSAGQPQSFGIASVGRTAAKRSKAQRDDDEVEKEKDKNDGGETRTIAGRKFRKQGGVWIDTAYSAPRVTTNLTRNSEQYRALIADEPGIKTIADQLDGEVIVVWKGRAYRIR